MKRTISLVLALSLMIGLFVVPTSAATNTVTAKDVLYDTASVDQWNAYFTGAIFGDLANSYKWSMLNDPIKVAGVGSLASLSSLESARSRFLAKHKSICTNPVYIIGNLLVDGHAVNPIIAYDESLGVYRLKDSRSGLWLVSNLGTFPYYAPSVTDSTTGTTTPDPDLGGKWILESKVNWKKVNVLSEYNLYSMGGQLKSAVPDNDIGTYEKKYYYLGGKWDDDSSGDHYVYCDASGRPYVARIEENQWSQNNTNNYYTDVTEQGDTIYNTGDTIENQLIDNSTNTVWFPDGTLNYIDNLIYDASTKTYYVDAHQEYDLTNNTYITNHYKYEYHINYTSVTYIGQTEEYDERYEFYYELPDGRSSADLTAEELQVLNTQIDVLPYIRSADDTSIRALYHFDGDCLDSSYWSHLGSLKWNKGASITYMDAGAFNGALYLDENAHDFTITLPSNIASGDFTFQFRYYQSYTAAPVNDSTVTFGGFKFLSFDGANVMTGSGKVLSSVSVGNWQEIAFVRENGVYRWYHNGVPVYSINGSASLSDTINFVFGSDQQTYKYIDEIRVVNKALYDADGYTPTSVPFDTNLALVLPDSHLPVADEYWSITSSGENLLSEYGMDWMTELYTAGNDYWTDQGSPVYPVWGVDSPMAGTMVSVDGGLSLYSFSGADEAESPEFYGLSSRVYYKKGSSAADYVLPAGDYVFSIVLADGTIISCPFTRVNGTASSVCVQDAGYEVGFRYYTSGSSTVSRYQYLYVTPLEAEVWSTPIVYMELVEGDSTDLSAEFVSSVVVMDKDDLNTPSLAVRTDIDIKGYQLGGVRPSLPEKGIVWALIESGRINSLQIYNGQAWEAVDGRIWTGSRWVPYYAYDVLLLKDLWDIVESDPTLDPIYTETGFWTWLQNAWGGMIARLDAILSAIGGSGGSGDTSVAPDKYPSVEDDPSTEDDDGWTIIDLVVIVKDGVWKIVTGTVTTAVGGIASLADGISNVGGFFNAFDDNTPGGVLDMMNQGGSAVWD